jgi:hypothetical protein
MEARHFEGGFLRHRLWYKPPVHMSDYNTPGKQLSAEGRQNRKEQDTSQGVILGRVPQGASAWPCWGTIIAWSGPNLRQALRVPSVSYPK